MMIRKFDRTGLRPDNGLAATRLLPWPELNAPFEGSWCVVEPGAASGAHSHHEYEIWIAMTGAAEIVCDGTSTPFAEGDIAHFEPQVEHQVVNEGTGDFAMYAIWWDAAMTEQFTERDRTEA